ncbi:MAG: hypothetical protein U0872_10890 [Planctomycetaceae bacterium]
MPLSAVQFLEQSRLQALIDELRRGQYEVVGPTIDQEAIVYGEITAVTQLPCGWTDEHAPGHYRLKQGQPGAWFGYVVGPHSWKKYLFYPRTTLLTAQTDHGWMFLPPPVSKQKFALLGVRACELAAARAGSRFSERTLSGCRLPGAA